MGKSKGQTNRLRKAHDAKSSRAESAQDLAYGAEVGTERRKFDAFRGLKRIEETPKPWLDTADRTEITSVREDGSKGQHTRFALPKSPKEAFRALSETTEVPAVSVPPELTVGQRAYVTRAGVTDMYAVIKGGRWGYGIFMPSDPTRPFRPSSLPQELNRAQRRAHLQPKEKQENWGLDQRPPLGGRLYDVYRGASVRVAEGDDWVTYHMLHAIHPWRSSDAGKPLLFRRGEYHLPHPRKAEWIGPPGFSNMPRVDRERTKLKITRHNTEHVAEMWCTWLVRAGRYDRAYNRFLKETGIAPIPLNKTTRRGWPVQ